MSTESFVLSDMPTDQLFIIPETAEKVNGGSVKGASAFKKKEDGTFVRVIPGQERPVGEFKKFVTNKKQPVVPIW